MSSSSDHPCKLHIGSPVVSFVLFLVVYFSSPSSSTSSRFFNHFDQTKTEIYGYPHRESSSISYGMAIVAFVIPSFICAVLFEFQIFNRSLTWQQRSVQFCNILAAAAEANFLTTSATILIKTSVGYLRPDFAHRCYGPNVRFNSSLPEQPFTCPQDGSDRILIEGRRSFLSGHTSTSICLGWFLTLYLLWCIYLRKSESCLARKVPGISFLKEVAFVPCLGPICAAGVVGISRITDFRHHPVDVVAGAVVGFFFGSMSFGRMVFFWEAGRIESSDTNPVMEPFT